MGGSVRVLVRGLESLEEAIAMLLIAVTSALVFAGATGRAVGHPLPWSVDCAQLAFIWTCMFCADVALRRHAHIRIDALLLKLPAGPRRIVEILIVLVELAFLVVLAKYGIELALSNWQRQLGATSFSYGWVTTAMPFGAILMSITLLRHLAGLVFNRGPVAGESAANAPADAHGGKIER